MTLEQILDIGYDLPKIREGIYHRGSKEDIKALEAWMQNDATTHNIEEFGKWIQEQKEQNQKLQED